MSGDSGDKNANRPDSPAVEAANPETANPEAEVVVYARPGCPFCSMLRSGLAGKGLTYREVDIWEHPEAAAAVRAVANGNETVPTVNVGARWMVNPSAREVLAAVRAEAPHLLPSDSDRQPGVIGRLFGRAGQ